MQLYIGAKVNEGLSPMINRHTPAADADKAWMGDCTSRCAWLRATDQGAAISLSCGQRERRQRWRGCRSAAAPDALVLHRRQGARAADSQDHGPALPVRPEWGPHGVVPHDRFSAAYKEDADGRGYSLEYRIPWDTLNAGASHPVAGDIVTATEQFLWGDGSGLNNIAAAYDLMSQPGFPWQTTAPWGKAIFSANSNDSA